MRLIKQEKEKTNIIFNGEQYLRLNKKNILWFIDENDKFEECSEAFSFMLEEIYKQTIVPDLRKKKLERIV